MKKTIKIVSNLIKVEIVELKQHAAKYQAESLSLGIFGHGSSIENALADFMDSYLKGIGKERFKYLFTVEEVQDE